MACSRPAAPSREVRAPDHEVRAPDDTVRAPDDMVRAPDHAVRAPDAPGPSLAVVDAPLAWSDERARLTLAYRRAHSDPGATDLAIEPRVIVIHYTGGGSAAATRAYFDHVRIEAARAEL